MDVRELRNTYNQIAKDYVIDHGKDTWDDDYIKFFTDTLSKNARVLDLGCGPGIDSQKLVKYGLSVDGLDLSDELLAIAKKINPSLTFTQGDMRKLPYRDNKFEGVFAKASLLHIPKKDMPKVINEIKRVLKPSGIVHIAIKGGEGEGELTENDYGYMYSRFFSYWKMEDILKILKDSGFTVLKQETWHRTEFSYSIWLKIIAKNKI